MVRPPHPHRPYGRRRRQPARSGRQRHREVEASRWPSVRSSTSSSGSPATSSTARSPPSSASSSRAARSASSTSSSSPRTPTATSRAIEFEDHDDVALFNALEGEVGGFISDEDIEYAATELEPNSSAALLIWEDVWATPFVEAMRNSGGVLIEGSRIPHDLIEAAEAELAAGRLTHRPTPQAQRRTVMLRRRPIARAAVTTSVVVGTAARTAEPRRSPPGPARPLTDPPTTDNQRR